jgi:hypothetical protein
MQQDRGESSTDDESAPGVATEAEPATSTSHGDRFESTDWLGLSAEELATIVESTEIGAYSVAINVAGDPAVVATTAPEGATDVIIAILTAESAGATANSEDLAVYTSTSPSRGEYDTVFELELIATTVAVDQIRVLSMTDSRPDSVGFSVIARKNDETFEFFILPTEAGSYVIRTPLSPVSRSVLRDITGSTTKELLQYSRVFEAGGKREIIIDSFDWVGDGFVHERSLSLLRRVNERLSTFKGEIESRSIGINRLQGALEPSPDAPPVTELTGLRDAVVPEVSELLVDLGAPEWTISHEIALVDDRREPFVYRIRLRLEANPHSSSAVTIVGID